MDSQEVIDQQSLTLCYIFGDIYFLMLFQLPMTFCLLLYQQTENSSLVQLWLHGVWQSDNGALLFGKLFGSTKCFPRISPSKTKEGIIGAYTFTTISLILFQLILSPIYFPWVPLEHIIPLTLVISSFSILGDLAESFLKRVSLVKDAGTIIPGHGGILDRIDSMSLGAPAVYFYVKLIQPNIVCWLSLTMIRYNI